MRRSTAVWLWAGWVALFGFRGQAQVFERKPEALLEKTQWKLIWLSGTKIDSATPLQMPYIQLNPEAHRVNGSGGCNRLVGTYELKGEHLQFTQLAMTRMACLHGGDTEANFADSLNQVRSWKIEGRKLLVMDQDQHVLAKFSAVAPEE